MLLCCKRAEHCVTNNMAASVVLLQNVSSSTLKNRMQFECSFQMTPKNEICYGKSRKHCGKRRNAGYQARFKFNARKLAKCGLNLKNASRKIKPSNLFASPIFRPLYLGQSKSRKQEMRRYCLCAVIICN